MNPKELFPSIKNLKVLAHQRSRIWLGTTRTSVERQGLFVFMLPSAKGQREIQRRLRVMKGHANLLRPGNKDFMCALQLHVVCENGNNKSYHVSAFSFIQKSSSWHLQLITLDLVSQTTRIERINRRAYENEAVQERSWA